MSELPVGWTETPLDTVVGILDSRRIPVNAKEREKRIEGKQREELYPYYGATGQVGYIDDYIFDEPLILLGEDGVPFLDPIRPKAYLADGKYWVNNHAHVLKAIEGVSDRRFICAFLNAIDYREKVTGTTRLKLTQEAMRTIQVLLAPINEQKRIAEKLDSLLARVDSCQTHLERVPQILKRFRQSVLAAATSGRLTEGWREENGVDSGNWENTVFDSVCNEITVGYVGKMASEYRDKGIPFLRSLNVRPFRFDPTDLKYISKEFHKRISKSALHPGDVVIVRSGAPGQCCVIPANLPEANCSDLVIVRVGAKLLPEFAVVFINSEVSQSFVRSEQVGVAQQHFNVGSMKKAPLHLPSLEEQAEIVRRVEKLFAYAERLEARYVSAAKRVERLTPSLLAKAFRGELVEQDPKDEPASVLLERIRQARTGAPKESVSPTRRSDMKRTKSKKEGKRISIIQALEEAGRVLSSEQLFAAAGFPLDANSGLVEEFLVEIRDALQNNQIKREREHNTDWFSLSEL